MTKPATPAILLRNFFRDDAVDFRITNTKKTLEMILEGYEWASVRAFNTAKRAALHNCMDAKLDAIWFEAQARTFEHLLIALNVGSDKPWSRQYQKNWSWMQTGRPYQFKSDWLITDSMLDNAGELTPAAPPNPHPASTHT